jgi:hypothetical protein
MNRRFQREVILTCLAWLDDEELYALQRAMLSNGRNEICGHRLRSLNEQAAIRIGKLGSSRDRGQRPDFEQYLISELDAAVNLRQYGKSILRQR